MCQRDPCFHTAAVRVSKQSGPNLAARFPPCLEVDSKRRNSDKKGVDV